MEGSLGREAYPFMHPTIFHIRKAIKYYYICIRTDSVRTLCEYSQKKDLENYCHSKGQLIIKSHQQKFEKTHGSIMQISTDSFTINFVVHDLSHKNIPHD